MCWLAEMRTAIPFAKFGGTDEMCHVVGEQDYMLSRMGNLERLVVNVLQPRPRRAAQFKKPLASRNRGMIKSGKRITIVTPVFNEINTIRDCCDAVKHVFESELPEFDYEHIICDNASNDGTTDELRRLASQDGRLRVIVNNRNYGAVPSNLNGIFSASGDAVLLCLPADFARSTGDDTPILFATGMKVTRWSAE